MDKGKVQLEEFLYVPLFLATTTPGNYMNRTGPVQRPAAMACYSHVNVPRPVNDTKAMETTVGDARVLLATRVLFWLKQYRDQSV